LLVIRLMASSNERRLGPSAHRTLGITYKSAWFLAHCIREAINDTGSSAPLGGEGAFAPILEASMAPISM
jgi:hypothetical protein